jgi:hypothetical protein
MAVKAECEKMQSFSDKVENINKDIEIIEIHERYIDKSGINEIIALLEEKKTNTKIQALDSLPNKILF